MILHTLCIVTQKHTYIYIHVYECVPSPCFSSPASSNPFSSSAPSMPSVCSLRLFFRHSLFAPRHCFARFFRRGIHQILSVSQVSSTRTQPKCNTSRVPRPRQDKLGRRPHSIPPIPCWYQFIPTRFRLLPERIRKKKLRGSVRVTVVSHAPLLSSNTCDASRVPGPDQNSSLCDLNPHTMT